MRTAIRTRGHGALRRWLDQRRLNRRQAIASPTVGLLVHRKESDEEALTYAEEAEFLAARTAMDTIEAKFNSSAADELAKLAEAAVVLREAESELDRRLQSESRAQERAEEFASRLHRDGLETRAARHMSRSARLALLVVFAVADVIAFRAAIAFLLDAPDDEWGRIETLLFACISTGMIVAAAYAGERVRYWLDARHAELAGLTDTTDSQSALNELRWTGIPALITSIVILVAAALLRIQALGADQPAVVWVGVPIFSLASLAGALIVELRYANKYLDKLDHFNARAARESKRREQVGRKATQLGSAYDSQEVRVSTLWSRYEPLWVLQADLASQRIAASRAVRPDMFHPLGNDIKSIVEGLMKHDRRILDVERVLCDRHLGIRDVEVDLPDVEADLPTSVDSAVAEAPTQEHGGGEGVGRGMDRVDVDVADSRVTATTEAKDRAA